MFLSHLGISTVRGGCDRVLPMPLNYDIDILPAEGSPSLHIAAFRYPETAAAARRASPRTLAILNDAGVALDSYSSGAPAGHFPLRDAQRRAYLASCMKAALTQDPESKPPENDGDFDLDQCLVELAAARPYGALALRDGYSLSAMTKPNVAVYLAISVLAATGYVAGFAVFG